jgi:hypothetical protein
MPSVKRVNTIVLKAVLKDIKHSKAVDIMDASVKCN